jgi:hypothetical protein
MPPIRTRKRRARHFTPPPNLCPENEGHALTPRHAGVFWAKVFGQEMGKAIPITIVEKVTKLSARV